MKFSTSAAVLQAAMNRASTVIATRANLVAYTGVHLEVAAGHLTVSGADGETTVAVTTKVTDTVTGQALLPPKPILRYLTTLPGNTPVTVETLTDTELAITAGTKDPYRFKTLATTFPAPAALRRDKQQADLALLGAAVAAVAVSAGAFSSSRDKVVQLVSDDTGLRLHSTDRYRLTRAVLPAQSSFGTFDGLLSLRVLELVATINPTHVQVDTKGRALVFSSPDTTVTTRLLSDPFPTVDSVLDAIPLYTTQVPREPAMAALRRLSAIAEDGVPLVATLTGDELTLSLKSNNVGAGSETITLPEAVPADISFGANRDFLEQAISCHSGASVTLGWTAALQPLFLTSPAKVPVTNVIMPVQVAD